MSNREMMRDYREMAAWARERGMLASAKSWDGLAEAAQRDLERESQACWSQELGMRAFEDATWARYQAEEAIELLCEGCHRAEEMCICGGVPAPHWATEWEKHSLLDYRREEF